MRILKIKFENIGLFEQGFEIDFIARDRVTDRNYVYNFHKNFNLQSTIALIGANASGKTSALQLIDMVFSVVLKQESLKNLLIPKGLIQDNSVMIVDFFDVANKCYYRLESYFEYIHVSDSEDNLLTFKYSKENIYQKKVSKVTNKTQITEFSSEDIMLTRDDLRKEVHFLRDDDSMLFYVIKSDLRKSGRMFKSMINENMMNFYRVSGNAVMTDINIFDDSIDTMELEDSQLKVKFKNKSGELVCNTMPNQNYLLSSGTAKGGNVLYWLKGIIRSGGYLIIDELENHFHKRLVQFVIELFNDNEINRNGATLIFTTHYAEILDSIERKDNIYVLRRNKSYVSEVIRYSDKIERIENKKSEVFLSNYIKGTSPAYNSIQEFKESIWE
ncbi:MAG: ATP-binding protein [Bacillota bacterium]|nr:ATP-binding protein [Bacillota bacterium]